MQYITRVHVAICVHSCHNGFVPIVTEGKIVKWLQTLFQRFRKKPPIATSNTAMIVDMKQARDAAKFKRQKESEDSLMEKARRYDCADIVEALISTGKFETAEKYLSEQAARRKPRAQ